MELELQSHASTRLSDDLDRFIESDVSPERGVEIGADTDLVMSGLVDSLGVVMIVEWLERRVGITIDPGDVVMSHVSVNFDRTGFQQDLNVCFPLQRLHDLAAEGVIGSVAGFHYTVSGAAHPLDLAESARAIAGMMKAIRMVAA